MWRCGVLVVMTRKVFWNAYRQRYVKLLRNRPFSPQIIRENLWLALKPQNSLFTQFFCKDFSATNSHKFPQIIFSLNLVESVWTFGSKGAEHPWDFPPIKKACEICAICVSPRKQGGQQIWNGFRKYYKNFGFYSEFLIRFLDSWAKTTIFAHIILRFSIICTRF